MTFRLQGDWASIPAHSKHSRSGWTRRSSGIIVRLRTGSHGRYSWLSSHSGPLPLNERERLADCEVFVNIGGFTFEVAEPAVADPTWDIRWARAQADALSGMLDRLRAQLERWRVASSAVAVPPAARCTRVYNRG